MTKLYIQLLPKVPRKKRDRRGRIIQESQTEEHVVDALCALSLPLRRLEFDVSVRVPGSLAQRSKDARRIAMAWLVDELPKRFRWDTSWNFYKRTELSLTPGTKVAFLNRDHYERDVVLSIFVAALACEAATHLGKIETTFEAARHRLCNLSSTNDRVGYRQTLAEGSELLRMIERVLNDGSMIGCFVAADAHNALKDYETLTRRNVSASQYISALSCLRIFTHGIAMPRTWKCRPAG